MAVDSNAVADALERRLTRAEIALVNRLVPVAKADLRLYLRRDIEPTTHTNEEHKVDRRTSDAPLRVQPDYVPIGTLDVVRIEDIVVNPVDYVLNGNYIEFIGLLTFGRMSMISPFVTVSLDYTTKLKDGWAEVFDGVITERVAREVRDASNEAAKASRGEGGASSISVEGYAVSYPASGTVLVSNGYTAAELERVSRLKHRIIK